MSSLFMLDVIGHKFIIIFAKRNSTVLQSNANRQHRLHLERLSKQLIEIAINKIMLEWQTNNAHSVQRSIIERILSTTTVYSIHTKRYVCYVCTERSRCGITCYLCYEFICKDHITKQNMCSNCKP